MSGEFQEEYFSFFPEVRMPLWTVLEYEKNERSMALPLSCGSRRGFLSGGEGKEKDFLLWINAVSSDMPVCGNPAKRQDMHSVHNAFCRGSSEVTDHESHLLFESFHNVA